MEGEGRPTRDYLAGSRLVAGCARLAQWFFRRIEELLGKLAWPEFSPQALSACLVAALLSNILVLFLLRREFSAWGLLLRGAGCLTALVGLFGPGDWRSVRGSSLFLRFLGKFHADR